MKVKKNESKINLEWKDDPDTVKQLKENEERLRAMLAKPVFMPESVKVDNVDYKIIEKEHVITNARLRFGLVEYDRSEISVCRDISIGNKKAVVMHEIAHAISVERDVKNLIPEEHYEKIIDEMSKGFHQVIRDNPELIKFIQ